ncbi:MAG: ATP-dependent sacrificial sulfur transferase LarE [Candidatus Freyarchaeota archaeon]|nr:ATP-dependent sacrificial sulfur transferase LarE [Candidatus Jordarchaeia archaeon]
MEKYERLKKFILDKGCRGVVVAFSGGVDSSTLAAVCRELLDDKVVVATVVSPLLPQEEVEDAGRVAGEIGVRHVLVECDILSDENFVRNSEDRCYFCKRRVLRALKKVAGERGLGVVFEGTSLSDLERHRPGWRAVAEEESVYSPWVEAGFTKEEVRRLARMLGLSVHDKPSMACLASRIPFNERITVERLVRIGRAEAAVRRITGVRQVRVRDHGGLARIEVERDEVKRFLDAEVVRNIVEELKGLGFKYVTLDLEGYREGSMLLT